MRYIGHFQNQSLQLIQTPEFKQKQKILAFQVGIELMYLAQMVTEQDVEIGKKPHEEMLKRADV